MSIVFGSPAAREIIERDRKLRQAEAELAKEGMTVAEAQQRLNEIDDEIYALSIERFELWQKLRLAKIEQAEEKRAKENGHE